MSNLKLCPITYDAITENEQYSLKGLKQLSPNLTHLNDFPMSSAMQRQEALNRADKMSIQGVQPKLSAKLNVKKHCFEVVDEKGNYILKPQSDLYEQAPENEDLTMRLATIANIEVPFHGLFYNIDGQLTYFIKRFDRGPRGQKIAIEDFAQLSGHDRDTKYSYSMEKLAILLDRFCTFPLLEKANLFRRVLFNYITGNEDMHLKNFSLISYDEKVTLSPAYDLLNSTIIMGNSREEIALPLNGKKSNLTKKDMLNYYGLQRLKLPENIVMQEFTNLLNKKDKFLSLIDHCFLSVKLVERYKELLIKRMAVLS